MVESKSSASCRRLTGSTDGRYPLVVSHRWWYARDGWGFLILSLRRLTSATTPKAGNVTYTYYDYGKVNTRTDARGEVTTYGYDGLHRL